MPTLPLEILMFYSLNTMSCPIVYVDNIICQYSISYAFNIIPCLHLFNLYLGSIVVFWIAVASTSTGCVVGCGLLTEG